MQNIFLKFFSCLGIVFFGYAMKPVLEADLSLKNSSIHRATEMMELKPFESIQRIESYEEGLQKETPFGVYLLKDSKNVPVGIQSFSPRNQFGLVIAEEITDILPEHQGKGYGSALRQKTIEIFTQQTSKFDYLLSESEWNWGENHASLKSSLNAGYGIVSVTSSGLVQMLFPRTESMWSDERINHFLNASKLLNLTPWDGKSMGDTQHDLTIVDELMWVIRDLDLSKPADAVSFTHLVRFLDSRDAIKAYQKQQLANFSSDPNKQEMFQKFSKFKENPKDFNEQVKASSDLLRLCCFWEF